MTSLSNYIAGFLLSLLLTFAAAWFAWQYSQAYQPWFGPEFVYGALVLLAVLQLLVQLYFFLHLGDEKKPRWHSMALYFAVMVVAILVGGTLWIMSNLSHGQMTNERDIEGAITPQNLYD